MIMKPNLMLKLQMLLLKYRIDMSKLTMVFKGLNNMGPIYLSEMFKFNSNSVYSLRCQSANLLYTPKPRTEYLRKSQSYSGSNFGINYLEGSQNFYRVNLIHNCMCNLWQNDVGISSLSLPLGFYMTVFSLFAQYCGDPMPHPFIICLVKRLVVSASAFQCPRFFGPGWPQISVHRITDSRRSASSWIR